MNTLRQAVHEYLAMRRSLGFKLKDGGKALLDFIGYMEQRQAVYITAALALEWAQLPVNAQPAHWARRLCFVRGFARYCCASDPRTEIPPPGLLPFQPKRAHPYLYSDEEIDQLLRAALGLSFRYRRCALLPWAYYCLLGLLSVTGMRLGEARNLKVQDVDLETAVLTVRHAKYDRTRLLPLHASSCKALADYLDRRQQHWKGRSVSPYLFISSRGGPLDMGQIHRVFYQLSRQIGLRTETDSHGPRLHDLRHRFATNTLLNWYRSGQDPAHRLPLLSAYLGHVHVADTQWYLEATPELMREAMQRLEHRWGDPS